MKNVPRPPIETRFGRRVVVGYEPPRHGRTVRVIMKCDCGNVSPSELRDILADKSQQCQKCAVTSSLDNLHAQTRAANQLKDRSADHTKQPEYICWAAMRSRCNNPNNPAFDRYGGAGITICPEWDDFQVFLRDMGRRPSKDHTIERKEGHKGYTPENCIWADWDTQQNNRKNNVVLEFGGRRQTVAQWARELGIGDTTVRMRLDAGWTVERALTTPVSEEHSRKAKSSHPSGPA